MLQVCVGIRQLAKIYFVQCWKPAFLLEHVQSKLQCKWKRDDLFSFSQFLCMILNVIKWDVKSLKCIKCNCAAWFLITPYHFQSCCSNSCSFKAIFWCQKQNNIHFCFLFFICKKVAFCFYCHFTNYLNYLYESWTLTGRLWASACDKKK